MGVSCRIRGHGHGLSSSARRLPWSGLSSKGRRLPWSGLRNSARARRRPARATTRAVSMALAGARSGHDQGLPRGRRATGPVSRARGGRRRSALGPSRCRPCARLRRHRRVARGAWLAARGRRRVGAVAWLAAHCSRNAVGVITRVAWRTVRAIITRVVAEWAGSPRPARRSVPDPYRRDQLPARPTLPRGRRPRQPPARVVARRPARVVGRRPARVVGRRGLLDRAGRAAAGTSRSSAPTRSTSSPGPPRPSIRSGATSGKRPGGTVRRHSRRISRAPGSRRSGYPLAHAPRAMSDRAVRISATGHAASRTRARHIPQPQLGLAASSSAARTAAVRGLPTRSGVPRGRVRLPRCAIATNDRAWVGWTGSRSHPRIIVPVAGSSGGVGTRAPSGDPVAQWGPGRAAGTLSRSGDPVAQRGPGRPAGTLSRSGDPVAQRGPGRAAGTRARSGNRRRALRPPDRAPG